MVGSFGEIEATDELVDAGDGAVGVVDAGDDLGSSGDEQGAQLSVGVTHVDDVGDLGQRQAESLRQRDDAPEDVELPGRVSR